MISLTTSVDGAAPAGGVTFGLLASGPLVGVFAAAVVGVVGVVLGGVVSPFTCGTELMFDSFPTVIELAPLEPHPATRAAMPSVARTVGRGARECLRVCEGLKFITRS